MTAAGEQSCAVVLLPAATAFRTVSPSDRRRLAKARLRTLDADSEPLNRVLPLLGRPAFGEGLAALRWWGQHDERPAQWLCGADPVYLEARRDHVRLHAVPDLADDEFALLLDYLAAHLAGDSRQFTPAPGARGYCAGASIATAAISAAAVHGRAPDPFLPQGPQAAAHDLLQSEVQMCLHEAEINRAREGAGRLPVNALWFWGGGRLPEAAAAPLPPLFGDDAVFRGYWLHAGADTAAWPGRLEDCAAAAPQGFVAVPPAAGDAGGGSWLSAARRLFRPGIRRVLLVFRDGFAAELRPGDRWRFWRRAVPPANEPPPR